MYRYLQNPFMSVTVNSFKKMMLMGRDHRDKLSRYIADPEIQNLYAIFNPAFTNFENAYSAVNDNAADYKGYTQEFEELMAELVANKIRQWDIWIQNEYLDNTANYQRLLPQGRKPFQTGAYELKIDAVRTLNNSLDRFPNLANTKVDVKNFLDRIDLARTAQQQVEAADQSLRQELEQSRVALALEMHRIFGFLLYKHYKNPADMSRYYEFKYLQAPASSASLVLSKYNVAATSQITLFDGLLTANSFITLKNTGNTVLKVFTTNDASAVAPNDITELGVGEKQQFYANELSDGLGYNWLVIINSSNSEAKLEAGKEEIEAE